MKKNVIIDYRMRNIEKDKLKSLGYNLIQVKENKKIYNEISSHVDINLSKINDVLVMEKNCYNLFDENEKLIIDNYIKNEKCVISDEEILNDYPNDIKYNICQVGNNLIHNFKYTNKDIIKLIDNENTNLKLNKIDIKQGYSNCSIAVIDDNSVIVSDLKIKEVLEKNKIDVLYIENSNKIKLLNNYKYSKMTGFIGGCISRLDDNIFVSGSLEKIDKDNKIRNYINKRNLNIIDFKDLDVIDYGGIICI